MIKTVTLTGATSSRRPAAMRTLVLAVTLTLLVALSLAALIASGVSRAQEVARTTDSAVVDLSWLD